MAAIEFSEYALVSLMRLELLAFPPGGAQDLGGKTNKKLFHIGYYVHLFMLLIIFPTLRPCYIN